jgi:hypothetical protein
MNNEEIGGAMTSERQAEANRQNAQKSTGSRTPAGKAVVALNGIKIRAELALCQNAFGPTQGN